MARAVAHVLTSESPALEVVRFTLVTGATLALIFAGRFLPF